MGRTGLILISLSLAIAHAPTYERQRYLSEILHRLNPDEMRTHLTRFDVVSRPRLTGRAAVWPTAQAAWAMAGGATHHLVLQDDALPCVGFLDGVHHLLALRPHHIISLWNARRKLVDDLRAAGVMWWVAPANTTGVAVVMPAALAREFLAWEAAVVDPALPADDVRLAAFAKWSGQPIWHTTPSLVHHAGYQSSLIGYPAHPNRVEHWWLDQTSPLALDWTVPEQPRRVVEVNPATRDILRAIDRGERHIFRGNC